MAKKFSVNGRCQTQIQSAQRKAGRINTNTNTPVHTHTPSNGTFKLLRTKDRHNFESNEKKKKH